MSLKKDIEELVQADVISEETAEKIRRYYEAHSGSANHRLILIFGILGALLSGMGVILIMAYNWVDLTTQTKTILAFLPLAIAQLAGFYALVWRRGVPAWRESSAVGLFMAIGACLFLISQIFHFPGNAAALVLTWMLLILPAVYILHSGAASLLYIAGITWYAASVSYFTYPYVEAWLYWPLILAIVPYYIFIIRSHFHSFLTTLHHWVIPLSIVVVLGGFTVEHGIWMYQAYFSLFGLFYILGHTPPFDQYGKVQNGYLWVGQAGSAILLILLSFKWFWKKLPDQIPLLRETLDAPEFWIAAVLTATTLLMLLVRSWKSPQLRREAFAWIFLLFLACFILGVFSEFAYIVINILILGIAILTIRKGNRAGDFTELNFGLLMVAVLIFSRFFDSNISFLLRGLAFILVGLGFFLVNYSMYRKLRTHEK